MLALYERFCGKENLQLAYEKARRGKTNNPRVKEFSEHWRHNLALLRWELQTWAYRPRPLRRFVLRDPKTRLISVSDFRDRVVHHALVNILQPIFEPRFISDSYASRKGKGALTAVLRFERFQREASRNNTWRCFVLKADIRHYFDTVDHDVLIALLRRRVDDERVLSLAHLILDNHPTEKAGKGMPLGNWTSQFFANVYLDELDQYVKHTLKAKHYLRYVDDFVIIHNNKSVLADHQKRIGEFLEERLKLALHPDKCRIIPAASGVPLLGYRVYPRHRLLRTKNIRSITRKLGMMVEARAIGETTIGEILDTFQGWSSYAKHANTYRLRERLAKSLEKAEEPS